MKFFTSQLTFFVKNRTAKSNVKRLLIFLLVLGSIITVYSLLFHAIMLYEGKNFSFTTGFYWTLTVMSTLGFGDITFSSDLGRIFSIVVLLSGMLFLLVLLPFTFIEFFYAPWLKAQQQTRTPRSLLSETKDHVLITHYDPVTAALMKKLNDYHIPHYLITEDINKAQEYYDMEIPVVIGDLDDPVTYENMQIKNALLLVNTGNDMVNTNITFTAREVNPKIVVVTTANNNDSVDILKLAGANHVLQLGKILGKTLIRRIIGDTARIHVVGRFEELIIGEAIVKNTPFAGKTISKSKLRELFDVTVVGIWDRGRFVNPLPDTQLSDSSVLLLAGTVDQFRKYDEWMGIYSMTDTDIIIIGGGRVGRAASETLAERKIPFRLIEQDISRIKKDNPHYIHGSAADFDVLMKAGIKHASTVIVTPHDDDLNIYLTLYCRRLRPDIQIITRAVYDKNIATLHRAGADFVMSYASLGANSIFNIMEKADVLMVAEGLNIFKTTAQGIIVDKSILESGIRNNTGCSIIAIVCKDGLMANPKPERVIRMGDELILVGTIEAEKIFMDYIYSENE